MASTYDNSLRLELIATGEAASTWGDKTNANLTAIAAAFGYATQDGFAADANATTTVADGAADPARALYFKITSSATLTATRTLTIAPNTISRVMWIENATTGSQSIAISQGSGANVTIPAGKTAVVYLDGAGAGASVVDAMASLNIDGSITAAAGTFTTADINAGTIDGTVIGGTTPAALSATTGSFSSTLGVTGAATFASTLKTGGGAAGNTSKLMVNTVSGTAAGIQLFQDANESWIIENTASSTNLTFANSGATRLTISGSTGAATFSAGITATTGTFSGNVALPVGGVLSFGETSNAYLQEAAGTLYIGTSGSSALSLAVTTGAATFSGTVKTGTGSGETLSVGSVDVGKDIGLADGQGIVTGAARVMTFKTSGNVGIGVTPSASSATTNIELPYGATLSSRSNTTAPQFAMMSNAVGNWYEPTYKINGYATQYVQQGNDGTHAWSTAASGTAGNTITFTQAMTLSASGNLLVGNTIVNPASGFASQRGFGYAASTGKVEIATTANDAVMEIGKNNATDGSLIVFRKQGTAVGSIGTVSGLLGIGSGDAILAFDGTSNSMVPMSSQTGGASNGVLDFGASLRRFKDLYLSGGVYLGGTGAANLLDDYEEGTWTPTVSSGITSPTYAVQTGGYTKIGNRVFYNLFIQTTGGTANSSHVIFSGLPFSGVANTGSASIAYNNSGFRSTNEPTNFFVSGTTLETYEATGSTLIGTELGDATFDLRMSGTYMV
jgi:hypothetical protein